MNKFKIEHAVFSKLAKFKRCGSCFRCEEEGTFTRFWEIIKKPRKGVQVSCHSACSPDCISVDMKACEWWKPRWYWNAEQRWRRFKYNFGRWWCEHVRIPLGSRRKPLPLEWVDCLNAGGQLVRMGEPRCPHCGEMPYSIKQCVFCGQRFCDE